MYGPLLFIVGGGMLVLAFVLLRFAWREGNLAGGLEVSGMIALMGLTSVGFGLLVSGSVEAGLLLVTAMGVVFGIWMLFQMMRRWHVRWLAFLSGGIGGLLLVVSLPAGLEWGHLYARGLPVQAEVVGMLQGPTHDPDADDGFQRFPVTYVTYQFDAEAGGQQKRFQRQGELFGRYQKGTGLLRVRYDPADPNHSRMVREFRWTRNVLVTAGVFLALGIVLFVVSRRRPGRADASPGHRRSSPAVQH